jgi:transcriptional regulator with XRE-family HTH domain
MTNHMTSAQMRAARGLANWSVRELSERSGVHRNTITNFETGKSGGDEDTLNKIRAALESAGVEFTNGGQPGVRMKATGQDAPDVPADFAPGGFQTYFPAQPRRSPKTPR